MKVARTAFDGPSGIVLAQAPEPTPGAQEISVRVRAAGVNRADLLQTLGMYPAPPGVAADVPGLEYAGEVQAVGAAVTKWKVGDRVMGLVGGAAWSEVLTTHELEAMRIPPGLSFEQAAAVPEAFGTAFDALVLQAGLSLGQRVLVHAVASGVGTAALQISNALGATVIGTGRNAEKLARVAALGPCDTVLLEPGARFASRVRDIDVALDLVGGEWFGQTLQAMAPRGVVMVVGLVAGPEAEVSLATLLRKRLRVQGTVLRARALDEKISLARALERHVLPGFTTGRFKPVVDAVLPMTQIPAALGRMSSNDTFGKLVLTW